MNDFMMSTLLSWLIKDESFAALNKKTQILTHLLIVVNAIYTFVKLTKRILKIIEKYQQRERVAL